MIHSTTSKSAKLLPYKGKAILYCSVAKERILEYLDLLQLHCYMSNFINSEDKVFSLKNILQVMQTHVKC